jgi:dienelactone hydrolase
MCIDLIFYLLPSLLTHQAPSRFFPQTQQGADVIASSLNTRVYMPDFFEPNQAFSISKFPIKSDQDRADLQSFFGGPAKPPASVAKLKSFGEFLKSEGVNHIGVYGFCWGKILEFESIWRPLDD